MRLRDQKNKYLAVVFVLIASFVLGSIIYSIFLEKSEIVTIPEPVYLGPVVQIKNVQIPVELATTSEKINKGLSEREALPGIRGMLFVFKEPSLYRFWMLNMEFPLDMIWIEDGKIVSISENVSNDFDPTKPKFYTPSSPVRYVLEVNAGFSKKNNLLLGDPVIFKNFK